MADYDPVADVLFATKLSDMSKPSSLNNIVITSLIAAFGIAIATVSVAVSLLVKLGTRIDLSDDWAWLIFQIFWVASPFVALSWAKERSKRAWLAGIVATLLVWSALLASVDLSHGGGANIGMGLFMLASPLFVAAAAFGAAAARSKT